MNTTSPTCVSVQPGTAATPKFESTGSAAASDGFRREPPAWRANALFVASRARISARDGRGASAANAETDMTDAAATRLRMRIEPPQRPDRKTTLVTTPPCAACMPSHDCEKTREREVPRGEGPVRTDRHTSLADLSQRDRRRGQALRERCARCVAGSSDGDAAAGAASRGTRSFVDAGACGGATAAGFAPRATGPSPAAVRFSRSAATSASGSAFTRPIVRAASVTFARCSTSSIRRYACSTSVPTVSTP